MMPELNTRIRFFVRWSDTERAGTITRIAHNAGRSIMAKLTPSEQRLADLIAAMPGGSYCPGADIKATPELHRLIRRMERRGILRVEDTDDGPRFTVAAS